MAFKIGLVHKRLDLNGGTERDLFRTTEGLRDLGHEVHLFCSEYGVPAPHDVAAHCVPVMPFGRTARLWSFALRAPKIIERQRCDVVVAFGRSFGQEVLRSGGGTHRGFLQRLGQVGGVRRHLWQTLSVYHQSLLVLEKRQYLAPDLKKIIAPSKEVKRDIVAHYAVSGEKIIVLYNGVDEVRFHPERRREFGPAIRRRWNIPVEAHLVLFVGSGFRRKGLDRLISIWGSPRLRNAYLMVVGNDARFSRYRARAEGVAGERIRFTGFQEDVENYYAAADVVALPALQEAFGNVVLEALASGVAVLISCDVGAAELLTGTLTDGVVEHPDSSQELETRLLSLLSRAREPRFAEEARRIGEQNCWRNHFRKLETLLMEAAKTQSETCVA